ncbi:hypothetical protein [Solimonas marina]|uniref:Uncharacterized protein n=1 Tax=Solimonas marina TaxID=2714601 RepID=A0A969WB32_9GAMM|nr:hypothetical protein [Solimonas marina]NKF22894.1 hypothetical protein [Solimonas marina]
MHRVAIACLLSALASSPVLAADLSHCTTLDDDSARLACYDAAAGRHAPVAAVDAPKPMPKPRPVQAPAAATSSPAPTAAAPGAVDRFGAESLRGEAAAPHKAQEADQISSNMVGRFNGWPGKGTRFTLANGQVWEVNEDGSKAYRPVDNPEVTIKKGWLGSYFMYVDAVSARVKVKRVR